jgi:septum formation protein
MTTLETIDRINRYDIILASRSPRRQQLLEGAGIRFNVVKDLEMDEIYPAVLKREEIPMYLAQAKATLYASRIKNNTLLITADTIVYLNDEVIGKPNDAEDAVAMLTLLSGHMHEVFTGVCLKTANREIVFYAGTKVFFRKFAEDEIRYYVNTYKPFDKAGAYGVQEWIGYVGVEHIEGSFYNVMGLPVQKLYHELIKIIE